MYFTIMENNKYSFHEADHLKFDIKYINANGIRKKSC